MDVTEISYFDDNGTFIGNLFLEWEESNVGTFTLDCPCGAIPIGETLNLQATRMCRGDFVNQAFWEDANIEACEMLDFRLCEISEVSFKVPTASSFRSCC